MAPRHVALRLRLPAEYRIHEANCRVRRYQSEAWCLCEIAILMRTLRAMRSPYWFRHAHASHSLDRNAPISLVQATLGHSDISTTGRYLHARPSDSSSRYLPL
jgi:integrase/recombinase XerD